MERCKLCGNLRARLFTAPGGAMVCEHCNDAIKLMNYVRVRGFTDEQISEMIEEAKRRIEEAGQG